MKFLLFFWKPVLWLALITYGLLMPADELPVKPFLNIPYFDKIVHFILFFGLSLLLFRPFKKLKKNYLILAPAVAVLFGALLEISQHTLSMTRSSNFHDFLANTAGVMASVFFYYYFVSGKKWENLF